MRDIVIFGIVLAGCIAALRRPWIGVMLWTWLSLMSPHRYAYGFSYSAPLSLMAAGAVLVGLVATRERWNPFQHGAPVVIFAAMTGWITISWLAGYGTMDYLPEWERVIKINVMLLVTLALLRTRKQIEYFLLVCALSLTLLGAKGGLFTVATGGGYRVWGPPGSFVEGNNEFALALVTAIPLLRYVQLRMTKRWARIAVGLTMLLCVAAALGSHSRGALLATGAMATLLWWRGTKNRLVTGVAFVLVGLSMLSFMPDEWFARMNTIETYEEDRSALGRLSAWSMAWNSAFRHPFGLGMVAVRPEWFEAYSSYGLQFGTPVAHSIYFQMLGQHGFVGLALYLAIWATCWVMAGQLRARAKGIPEAQWCVELASLVQVSILAFLVGGAFLNLAHYDLPFNIMAMLVLTRAWFNRKAWLAEPDVATRWWR